jgi:hypothetical protein
MREAFLEAELVHVTRDTPVEYHLDWSTSIFLAACESFARVATRCLVRELSFQHVLLQA